MEVWTCKQNSYCFCNAPEFVHNRREITGNGQLESHRRKPCDHFWRACPHCYSFAPDGALVCHKES